jgi:hypothetical protein
MDETCLASVCEQDVFFYKKNGLFFFLMIGHSAARLGRRFLQMGWVGSGRQVLTWVRRCCGRGGPRLQISGQSVCARVGANRSVQHQARRGHRRLLKWKTDAAYRGRQDATRRHLLFAMADSRCFEMESKDPPVLLPTMWIVLSELPVAEDLEHTAQSG